MVARNGGNHGSCSEVLVKLSYHQENQPMQPQRGVTILAAEINPMQPQRGVTILAQSNGLLNRM